MSEVRGTPMLVTRRGRYDSSGMGFGWFETVEVADFSEDERPAYRCECHCRNCNWRGEARARIGEKWPMWLLCPKCENRELRVTGEFKGRDEQTREEEAAETERMYQDMQEAYERRRETGKSFWGGE